MIWLRKWHILVTDANDEVALDLSDLHISFEVKYAREVQNFATLKIYNLNQQTESRIIAEGDRVIIEAGYQAEGDDKPTQYGKIFDGQVIYPARSKESNTDYVLTLLCGDGRNLLGNNLVNRSINRGLNQRQLLNAVCEGTKIPIPIDYCTDGLSEQKLPRGRCLFGEGQDYISDIARGNAAGYYVADGKLTVDKITDEATGEALVVTPSTGLIGMPTQTQYGATFQLLLNPAVKLGTIIQLKNSEMNERVARPGETATPMDEDWMYQTIEVVHVGDTRGNDWYTNVTSISRYGKGSLAALMSNAQQNPNGV